MKFSDLLKFEVEAPIQDTVWADFLFELGYRVALVEPARVKVLLILPVIEMAAPLIALGYLYGRFNGIPSGTMSIDSFRQLPNGSGVVFNASTGPQQAVFEGLDSYAGMECVRIRVQSKEKGGCTQLVLPHQLNKILMLSNAAGQNTSERALGRNIAGISDFAKQVYGAENLENLAPILNSAWLIGKFNEISDELNCVSLSAKEPSTSGNFTDLLRTAHFLKPGEPSFSCVASCYKQDRFIMPPSTARITIFREGISYLRHQHYYPNASKIVLMDFADRNRDHVIETYNGEYYSRSEDWQFEFDQIPENLICAGYTEAGQA